MTPKILRPSPWIAVATVVADLLFLAGFLVTYRLRGASVTAGAFGVLSLIGIAGVLEAVRCRVELGDDTLTVSNLWRRRSYSRSELRSVTWARGCPVSLELSAGGWLKLPEVGSNSQATANIIRAWLKRKGSEQE